MAITIAFNPNEDIRLAPHHFYGLSSDTKPTVASPAGLPEPTVGSTFFEHDTGTLYVTYDGTNWVLDASNYVPDDVLFALGIDNDIVLLNRSTALTADAEVTNVIVGTSEHPGAAANSFILSNITASGDILFLVNKGGNSLGVFWADGSTGDTAILAASGASVDVYIAGTKIVDIASGIVQLLEADTRFVIGSDSNNAANFLYRTTILAADTVLTGVLEGTVESQAIAANSLMIVNNKDDGDIAFYVKKGANAQMAIWLDGSTGDTAVMAASGASVDHYIAGVKVLDHAAGAFAFQEDTVISSTGTLTVDAGAANLIILTTGNAGLYIKATNDTNGGALVETLHVSTTPADGDFIFGIHASGKNDATPTQEEIRYGAIYIKSSDITDGTEDGEIQFSLITNGAWDGKTFKMLPTGFFVTPNGVTVGALQVVGTRVIDARADDTPNSGDATTDGLIDALRDAMITHGLVAAA